MIAVRDDKGATYTRKSIGEQWEILEKSAIHGEVAWMKCFLFHPGLKYFTRMK